MTYSKTTWQDRAVSTPNKYTKSGETSTEVTLVPQPGTVTQAGTPINAANLNKIEQGIFDALPSAGGAMTGDITYNNTTAQIKNTGTSSGMLIEGKESSQLVVNASFDGTNWNRMDTSLPAYRARLGTTSGQLEFFRVAAGANPIAWSGPFKYWNSDNDGSGSGLDADLLDGMNADNVGTANTVVSRKSDGSIEASKNMHISTNGEARYHLYNGGATAEWNFGQKSNTNHDFIISKTVAGVDSDYFKIDTLGTAYTNIGGTWVPLGGNLTYVQSNNIGYSDATLRTLSLPGFSQTSFYLVYSWTPAYDGFIKVQADLTIQNGQGAWLIASSVNWGRQGNNPTLGTYAGATSSDEPSLTKYTPVGTVIASSGFSSAMSTYTLPDHVDGQVSATASGTVTNVMAVFAGVTVYFFLKGISNSGQNGPATIANFKIMYDRVVSG